MSRYPWLKDFSRCEKVCFTCCDLRKCVAISDEVKGGISTFYPFGFF